MFIDTAPSEVREETSDRRATDPETGSTLEMRDGFYILHLYGTPRQRGQAHGRLLREQILSCRIAPYFGAFFRDLYRGSTFAKRLPSFLSRRLGDLLEWWYYAPLEKLLLEETREELLGIAEAAGLDGKETLRAAVAPDLMEHLAAGGSLRRAARKGLKRPYHRLPGAFDFTQLGPLEI